MSELAASRPRQGIQVAGTLAVLFESSVRGQLNLPEEIGHLRRYGFRLSPCSSVTCPTDSSGSSPRNCDERDLLSSLTCVSASDHPWSAFCAALVFSYRARADSHSWSAADSFTSSIAW